MNCLHKRSKPLSKSEVLKSKNIVSKIFFKEILLSFLAKEIFSCFFPVKYGRFECQISIISVCFSKYYSCNYKCFKTFSIFCCYKLTSKCNVFFAFTYYLNNNNFIFFDNMLRNISTSDLRRQQNNFISSHKLFSYIC